MSFRKITTLTTDEHGEATYTYIGNTRGQVLFKAIKGNRQSTTIPIIDALFYDEGIPTHKNNNWYYSSNSYTETVATDNTGTQWEADGVQFGANSSSTLNYFLDPTGKWCLEMDVISYNDVTIRFRESTTSYTGFAFSSRGVTANSHIKIIYNGNNTLTYTIDDNTPATINTVEFTSNIGIGIRLNSSGSTLKWKNIKIYTITEDT